MKGLFQKLNLKEIRRVVVLGKPEGLQLPLEALAGLEVTSDSRFNRVRVAFAPMKADVDRLAGLVAPRLADDAVAWFAHPKGSSKRYRSDYNRDSGWDRPGAAGLEPVRQVSIDEDWSAL